MNITVACVLRSGGVYDSKWVDSLKRQVDKHLDQDRFVCMTNIPDLHWNYSDWEPLVEGWPGWWSKIHLFRPGQFAGLVIYFDLDSVLVKPIDGLIEKLTFCLTAGPSLAMLSDFYCPARPASGVMAWIPSKETEAIYHAFEADPKAGMRTRHGDGGFIGQFPHIRLQEIFPGAFGSYKAHKLDRGPGEFSHISMHGRPKQPDLPRGNWLREVWEG